MKSIWTETTKIPGRNPLPGNKKTEVAVIGAGLFGILAACYLKEQGKEVIVLEADRIGSGQSGYTTAKITSQHNLIYEKLVNTMGEKYASSYAMANQQAIEDYKKLIKKRRIACHFEEKDAYLFSVNESEILRREADCAARCGLPATFVRETELPFPVHGAVRFTGQAQFHPLEFIEALSGDLTVYERTKVREVKGHEIMTDRGVVRADHIVFACHYPFVNIPGFYFLRLYQEKSYVMALGPVKELEGMYLGIDKNSYSFRSAGDTLLLGHGSHRTEESLRGDETVKGTFLSGDGGIRKMVGRGLYECGQCAIHRPFFRRACGLVRSNGIWEMGHDDVDGCGEDRCGTDYGKKNAVRGGIYTAALQTKGGGRHVSLPCGSFCRRAYERGGAQGTPVSSYGLQACIQSDGRALRVPLPRITI